MSARASIALAGAAVRRTSTWHRGAGEDSTSEVAHTSEATNRRAMASADSAYDSNMAASGSGQEAARNAVYVLVQVVSPQGEKHPLKVRPSDDVATLRALCTQVSSGPLCAHGNTPGLRLASGGRESCFLHRSPTTTSSSQSWQQVLTRIRMPAD